MSQIRLRLLGQPEVWVGKRLATFATRKALALLAYLAVQGGLVARETLTALFWPESAPAQGRATLRSTLAYLRNALGETAGVILATRDALGVETGLDLDVRRLAAAAQATRQLPLVTGTAPASLRPVLAQLRAAADLYRGDFLEGFSLADAPGFDDWSSVQREAAHRQAAVVFDWLAQLLMDGGEPLEAQAALQRWLVHDPLNEASHRRLIQLHFANGDYAAALQAYEACRAILARELNAEPAPETQALVQRLRARRSAAAEGPARGRARGPSADWGLPPVSAEAPLVGRSAEHLALVQAFRLARRGQFQIVALEGEPGIGKTRLVKEFLAWAVGEGADVLHGRAFEAGAALPYQPIVEALRARLGQEPNPQRWLSLTWWGELSRLLPELADALPDLPRPLALGEGEARARLYEAVARLGGALAAQAPLVAFLDDAQWADAGTLALVRYLVQRYSQQSAHLAGLFVLAVRSDDLAAHPALAEWLRALGHVAPLRRLRLGALALDDIRRLVRALGIEPAAEGAQAQAIDAFCRRLFAETGGHPFFALQMLRALTESRAIWQDPTGAWHLPAEQSTVELPPGVRELVQARLARLGPSSLAACQAGAVLGEGFEFGVVCQVAELDDTAGLAAVDELLGRGLWREAASAPGQPERLSFTHDKLRETAYAGLSAARRRSLHRRALQALEREPASPAELAHHALAAAVRPAAFRYSLAAGDAASRVFAGRDALGHYSQAWALLGGGLPEAEGRAEPLDASPAEQQHLLLHMGAASEMVNDWGGANDHYERLLALARQHDWPAAEGLALNRLALVAAKSRFDIPAAAERLQAAQQAAARSGDLSVRAETQMNLAQIGLYRWDAQMMRSHGEHALALARELGQPELAARALNMLGYAGVVSGEWETIESLARESWELYAAADNRASGADSLGLLGASQTQSGRAGEGLPACRAAYTIGLELENEWVQANTAYHLANALLELGKLGQALEIGQRGVAAARVAGHPPLLVFNLAVCGSIYRAALALEAAQALHMEANAIAQSLQQPYLVEWAASDLCADDAFAANWPAAAEQAERALAVRAVDPTLKSYAGLTRWCQAAALARSGPEGHRRAAEDLRRLDQQTQAATYRRYRLAYLRASAELHLLAVNAAEMEQGLRLLEAAAKLAAAMELPVELWQVERRLGEGFQAAGQAALAQAALERAAQIARRLAEGITDDKLKERLLAAADG